MDTNCALKKPNLVRLCVTQAPDYNAELLRKEVEVGAGGDFPGEGANPSWSIV